MSVRLEILKHLFDEHFTHEDYLMHEIIKLKSKEAKELTRHMLSHPHAKQIHKISTPEFEGLKKRIPKKSRQL